MEQEIDKKSFIDTDIEEADNAHSNVGVYANLKEKSNPFSDITSSFDAPNLSTQLYNAIPSVFQDETFGLFNRAITQPIIDTADAAIRTADMALKGFATGANELKNLYTGEDDDRLKRDIYGFFTAGSPAAVTRPVNVAGRVKQLFDRGDDIEAGKLMYSQVKSPIAAMTKKREPSPVRKMTDAEKKAQGFDFEKKFDLPLAKARGQMELGMKKIAERLKAVTNNIKNTGYFDDYPIGSKYVGPRTGEEFTVVGYSVSSHRPDSQAMLTKLHSKRKDLIKSGALPKEITFFDGNDIRFSANKNVYDQNVYRPMLLARDKNGTIQTFNYDIILHQDQRKDEILGKVMQKTDAPKVNILDSTKEVPPLEIGSSKFALEGKLKSNLTSNSLKLFDDKARGATAGSAKANKLIGAPIKDGEKVGIRKNLNSKSLDGEKGVLQTIHQNNYNGKALSYQPYATVENVIFNVNQSHRRRIASKAKGLAVPESSAKFNMASVDGKYVADKNLLRDGYETEIAFNPAQGHLFIDVNTGQAVKGAKTATVVGDRVFANGVTYWKKADAPKPLDASDGTKLTGEVRYKFKRGGLMARA